MNQEVVVVVGGASGIGEACSRLMVERAWRVVVADIDIAAASRLADEIGARAMVLNVADASSIEADVERIETEVGPASAAVVTAAVFQPPTPPEEFPIEEWDRVMAIDLRGTYLANVAFGRRMVRRKKGSIVNLGSLAGIASMPLHAYGPAKAAVVNLTQNLAGEWGRSGVRVNSVTPGTTSTQRINERIASGVRYVGHPGQHTALGRLVTPQEVAETIEFLASDRASGITGSNILVDAGTIAASTWAMFGGLRQPKSV
jgi:NAD(P)-dependent dehydrogenase (short-subunit alcohol dehydrogenase family)